MPEQTNLDNYAYERDLILLNNLLMKRLLQQRMRMNAADTATATTTSSSKNKKTISDVYGPSSNLNTTVATREAKKNYSMVEAHRKTLITTNLNEQPISTKRSARNMHSRNTPTRTNHSINSTHSTHSSDEHLATVSEESVSEKPSPVASERPERNDRHERNKQRTTSTSSVETCEKQTSAPGQSSSQAPSSSIASSSIAVSPSESDQTFRKSTPTRHGQSRKSTVNKVSIRQMPACKQSNGNSKCCEESSSSKKATNFNQCPANVCTNVPPRPYFPTQQPLNNIPLQNPFRSYNFQQPALNHSFYYPYNNSFNYPLIRTNFNSFPQFNPIQPYNFQSNPFYLQTPNYFQPRPLEPLKPLKPLPMSHFQTAPLNGQTIIVL